MNSAIKFSDWLGTLNEEYLGTFVSQGGAAVKFLVPSSTAQTQVLAETICGESRDLGYHAISMDSSWVRMHLIDHIFQNVADQTPWANLTLGVLSKLLADAGYQMAHSAKGPLIEELARINGVDARALMLELRRLLSTNVYSRPELTKDFRVAMLHLCLATLNGGPAEDATNAAINNWLTGRNPAISAVKPYGIFNKIGRANARHHFESLIHWVRFSGKTGTVVVFDMNRMSLNRNPRDGSIHYTKAAFLDGMEVLRQFIDATDRASSFLLVVIAGPDFLEEDNPRSVHAYSALKARVFDEVRDRRVQNPMASLVRIAP